MNKRKSSEIAYTQANWVLKKAGLAVYNTMLWAKRPKTTRYEKWKKVKITIEEV